MRISLAVVCAISLVPAFAVPQPQNDVKGPACATECVKKTSPDPCKPDDFACICLNMNYAQKIGSCLEGSCTQAEIQEATDIHKTICADAGVDTEKPFPDCGMRCLEKTSTGDCGPDDGACQCSDDEYIQSVDECFQKECTGRDLETAELVGEALCRAYGVDISSIVQD